MGLFSSKKKITVNVTVQPVFDEAMIPKSVQAGVLKYILDPDIENLSDSINEELIGCTGTKINAGFGWAKREDYAAGIPTTHVINNIQAKDSVYQVIATNVGQNITPSYYRFGPMNSLHYAWQWLFSAYGYNAETNEIPGLTSETGFKCYLSDMRATYTRESYDFIMETYDAGVLEQLGPSPRSGWTPTNPYTELAPLGIGAYAEQPPYDISDTAVDDFVTITYEFEKPDKTIEKRSLNLAITGISDEDYHQVRYTKADGKTGFFSYLHGSGTYPTVDLAYLMQYNDLGTFYPWTYFRVQNSRVEPGGQFDQLYKDGKKWCNYIGVNFDTLSDGVHGDNDVDDVAQCILQVAVKPDNQHQAVIEYLFKHFAVLHESSVSQKVLAATLPEKFLAFSSSPSQAQRIMDRQFAQTLQYSGIARSRHAGSIGKKNTFTSHYGMVPSNAQLIESVNPTEGGTQTVWQEQPAYVYRWQVEDSVYEEIAVFGLRMDYQVHYKKGFGAGAGDPELLIPVDREILRTVSTAKREQVVCRGLHMLVNTVIITKSPWYASSAFKIILLVVAVVITVLSFGTAWQTVVAAAAISTTAAVIAIATLVLQYIVVTVAVKLFVKKFGAKLGFVAAVAAIAVGGYNIATGGSGMWGENLVALGNGLTKEASTEYNNLVTAAYEEMQDFQEWAQGKFDSLQDKKDELGLTQEWHGLTGFDFVGLSPMTVWGESPNDYYSRTVHSGNIGTSAYDMVEFYHSYKLQLPQINETQELLNGDELQ